MGSLMPGWDGKLPGVPPKELQDTEGTDEPPKGVFAKLEYSRSLKRSSMDPQHVTVGSPPGQPMLLPIPSLQRASSLRQGGPVPMPTASYGAAPASSVSQRHPLSSSLGTSSMMMRAAPGATGVTSPKAFKPTDWESEFKSLGSMKRTSMGPLGRTSGEPQTDSGRSSAEHHATTWWANMDSGLLNRGAAADAEAAEAGATHLKDLRGSFKLDLPTGMNLH